MSDKQTDTVVTILGSGTCVPSLLRSSCSVLIKAPQGTIVLDIGRGTIRRLLEAGIQIFDLSHIFLSHFHLDHSGELMPFLFSNKYPDANRRIKPITVVGGAGLTKFFNHLKEAYGHWVDLGNDKFRLRELNGDGHDEFKIGRLWVKTAPMRHNPESVAYRITIDSGDVIVYSGDSDYTKELIDIARGADLFICESAFPDGAKVPGHLTPSLAGKIASQAKVKKLVLTHFYPSCDREDIVSECRSTYSGPLVLAKDLLSFYFTSPKRIAKG